MGEEKEVGRRNWLKAAAGTVAGLVIGGAIVYLAKPAAPAEVVTETVTAPGPTVTATKTETVTATPPPLKPKYTYYFPSHIGPWDANMFWLTKSIEDISKIYPVKVEYTSLEEFSIPSFVKLLETAIAAKPDGLIVPIVSPEAVEEPLGRAIDEGIPVIASNIPDPRPPDVRIKYLSYVGAAEYPTGYKVNKRTFELVGAEKISKSVTFVHSPGHIGHEERARGQEDICKDMGIPYEKVAAHHTVEKAYDIMRSYIMANPDVNHGFVTAGWIARACKKAAEDAGKKPGEDFYISSVDASPFVLEPIREGWVVATHSQQFYLQGYYPPQWLYMYNEHGFLPPFDGTVGPVVVDPSNVEAWKTIAISVFGKELYDELAEH